MTHPLQRAPSSTTSTKRQGTPTGDIEDSCSSDCCEALSHDARSLHTPSEVLTESSSHVNAVDVARHFGRTLTFAQTISRLEREARFATVVRTALGKATEKGVHDTRQDTNSPVDVALERSLGWKGASANLMAFSIAIGIFNLPHAAAILGLFPFIIMVFVYQLIMWYSAMAYMSLQQRYPGIHSLPDAGELLWGQGGRIVFEYAQLFFCVLLAGIHITLGSYAFRVIGWKSCAILLNFVFMLLSFIVTLPRTYRLFAKLAFFSSLTVIVTALMASISALTHGPHANGKPVEKQTAFPIFRSVYSEPQSFYDVTYAMITMLFSFGADPIYFPLMAEMRRPKDFRKAFLSMIIVQSFLYIAVVVMCLYGLREYVRAPIFSTLSPSMAKWCYLVVTPGNLISGCAAAQVSGKQLLIKCVRKRPSLQCNWVGTWSLWIAINAVTWTVAWIFAEMIPFFSSFTALGSAVIWTLTALVSAFFLLFLNRGRLWSSSMARVETLCAVTYIAVCLFLAVVGIWSAIRTILAQYKTGKAERPFSCHVPIQ